jgi:hypothetical protein
LNTHGTKLSEKGKKMTNRNTTVPTTFGRNTRFDLPVAVAPATFRARLEIELAALKEKLLSAELDRTTSLDTNVRLRRAANEAVALAWLTPYPLLLLPALFEEKACTARRAAERQAQIRKRTSELLALAE